MNICDNAKPKGADFFINGNLYYQQESHGLCLCMKSQNSIQILCNLKKGFYYAKTNETDKNSWEDVTDQYCLKKIGT